MKMCSKCSINPKAQSHRWCLSCHSLYMRLWRTTHKMTTEQRIRDNARSYANVYKKRGKLIKKPCEKCDGVNSQMHHPDYSKPLDVVWLCRPCHFKLHEVSANGR